MKKTLIIAGLAFKEAIRKKILFFGMILTFLFLTLYGFGVRALFAESAVRNLPPGIRLEEVIKFEAALFLFMGLFIANMAGALGTALISSGTISGEIEQGIIQTIITRPISRTQIVLGKWLGHALLLSIYFSFLFLAIISIIYWQSGWLPNNVISAGAIFVLEILVILSLTIFGSTFLPTIANAVAVSLLFLTALIGGVMEQISVFVKAESLFTTGIISSLILPTDSLYRYAVTLLQPEMSASSAFSAAAGDMGPFGAASPPSILMVLYAILFCVAVTASAAVIFSKRDL